NIVSQLLAASYQPLGIEKVQVVAPGFINFYLSTEYLLAEAAQIMTQKGKYGTSNIGKGKTVLIDYSHPNIAKPIGVHHLLTTLIGDSIKRTYKSIGYKTIADNFLGDWGTQFGKAIYAYKKWGKKDVVEKDPINEILKLYVKFHEESEKDPELDNFGREEFKELEDGDKENRKLWEWMRAETIKELGEIYKTLGIEFDYYNGEAFYEDKLKDVLSELDKKGLLEAGNEGAKIVDLEKENLPVALVQKGDGATLYLTRDLAAIKYRAKTYKPEKILYVVETKQELHLAQLFAIAKKTDILDKSEPIHVKFGTMKFPEGGMSTRKGKVVYLWKVLEEAKERALKIINEKNPKLKDKEKVAEIVGIGSVKYAVLSQNRLRDVTFTWDKMLSLDGNSAPYIMYTNARCLSILRKSKTTVKGENLVKSFKGENLVKEESDLLRKLYLFPEIVEKSAEDYMPSHISTYVYDLSQTFNTFYNKLPVLNADEKVGGLRLKLVFATAQVLKNGMALLGIDLPEEM
ncbi:arginine--tRNA ligase, partial [bacterium (Candidatus Howlettbacteria) CG_4_10_14_0_8_um_filter_40_9]